MAGAIKIRSGTKLQVAFDAPMGEEPKFSMICSFNKSVDDSAFLISIPMVGGKPLPLDENQKLLIRYGTGSNAMILAGYPDDVVKDGIHRYWKIRRVSEQRQFFQRNDERVKVTLKCDYWQETWPLNDNGDIPKEDSMTLDVSSGGAALYLNRRFDVGEMVSMALPRIGTSEKGKGIDELVGNVCWLREAPKGSLYRNLCGLQFRFADPEEKKRLQLYLENVKDKYRI